MNLRIIDERKKEENQLSLNLSNTFSFWEESSTLAYTCLAYTPRVLDFFQKELKVSQKENVLLKYLFWYLDNDFIAEVSLNIISKTTCISRTTLTSAVK